MRSGSSGSRRRSSPSVPVWTVAITWSVGAAGMGLGYSQLSLVVLSEVVGWIEADSLLIGAGIMGAATLAGPVLSQRVAARLRGDPVSSPADRRPA